MKNIWGKSVQGFEHPKNIHILNTVPWKIVAGKFDLRMKLNWAFSPQMFLLSDF
jgi:hypothetical protein